MLGGDHHSSVDSSVPSILWSLVTNPKQTIYVFSIVSQLYYTYLSLYLEKDENKQKKLG